MQIYELELKVEKLEKELRENQQDTMKALDKRRELEIKQVEQVHEFEKLEHNVADLLKSRQRALSLYSNSRQVRTDTTLLNAAINNHATKISRSSYANQRRGLR